MVGLFTCCDSFLAWIAASCFFLIISASLARFRVHFYWSFFCCRVIPSGKDVLFLLSAFFFRFLALSWSRWLPRVILKWWTGVFKALGHVILCLHDWNNMMDLWKLQRYCDSSPATSVSFYMTGSLGKTERLKFYTIPLEKFVVEFDPV